MTYPLIFEAMYLISHRDVDAKSRLEKLTPVSSDKCPARHLHTPVSMYEA